MRELSSPRFGVSYFGNRYAHHARADMRAIKNAGADFVVLVMSESDLRWNPDTMTDLVTIVREEGLEPWLTAWAIGGVFGGETASYAVGEHPEACQRASDGRHLAALSPTHPAFRALMEAWLDVAAATGVDIVQWDEPQLALPFRNGISPYPWTDDWSDAFFDRFGLAVPAASTPEVELFLDDMLADLIVWLVDAARQRGLESAVVLLPDENYDPVRARAAAELAGVRYFGSTPFWIRHGIESGDVDDYLTAWAKRMVEATHGTHAEPFAWIQAFDVPAGREAEIEQGIAALVEGGVSTVSVWSYLGCAAMSGLACADPDAAWAATVRGFASAGNPR